MKKLVVEIIELEEEKTFTFPKGYRYSCFKDPETGLYYEPNDGFEVTGENLDELFHEAPTLSNA